MRGSGRVISAVFPCRADASRFISGIRHRQDGLRMELDSRKYIEWTVLFRGCYEPTLTKWIRSSLFAGATAVDVGANIGCHTLTMAEAVGEKGSVLSFEPNPITCEALARNINLNGFSNVKVYNCALGDAEENAVLHLPRRGSVEATNMGLASLVPIDSSDDVAVDVRTLDNVFRETDLKSVDLVKIDVQGFECKVLKGLREILSSYSPAVTFEFEDWAWQRSGATIAQARDILEPMGYNLFTVTADSGGRLRAIADSSFSQGHAELYALRRDARTRFVQCFQ